MNIIKKTKTHVWTSNTNSVGTPKGNQYNIYIFTDKFINILMYKGKKALAAKLFYDMLYFLKKRIDKDTDKKSIFDIKQYTHEYSVLHLLSQAVENVTPSLEVRKVRVAGTTYLVPAILKKKKQQTKAIRWIIESARKKQNIFKSSFSE